MRLTCLLILLVYAIAANGQEDTSVKKVPKFTLKGYIKYMEQLSFAGDATNLETNSLIHNRLNFRYRPDDHFNFRLEVRNRLYYGELVQNYPGFAALETNSYEPINLSKNWVNRNSVLLNSTIDRASAEYTNGKWDITLGRQRINWGINTVWTPNDLFNTFNYFDFDYEERPGSDAARVQFDFNSSSSLELDVSPGKTVQQNIEALMYHMNKWNYDFQVFSGIYHEDFTGGVGWAGNIKGAGFKGEVSWFSPYGNYSDSTSLTGSLSIDYGFKNGIYLLVSGLYNSLGKDSNINMVQLTQETLSAKNMFPFRFTAFAEVSYSFTPILKATLGGMFTPSGNSVVLLPSVTYSLSNNWALDIVGQSFFTQQAGAYQALGNSFYLRIKCGF